MKTFSEACEPFMKYEAPNGYAERFGPSVRDWVNAPETQLMSEQLMAKLAQEMERSGDFTVVLHKLFCAAFASGVAVGCEMERKEL